LSVLLFPSPSVPVSNPTPEIVEEVKQPISTEQLIQASAERYAVKYIDLYETLDCESMGFIDPAIQSGWYHNGVRENSWGYAQFNLPSGLKTADGRTITKEIAIDAEEAIDAAAYNFSIGNASQWSCYNGDDPR